jgi:hypothetical protein
MLASCARKIDVGSLGSVYAPGRDLREVRLVGRPDAWRCGKDDFKAGGKVMVLKVDPEVRQDSL